MELTDAEVMQRVRAGDLDAFEVLVDRHKDGLVNYLTHLRGDRDRAEEVAQEAFLRLFQYAHRYHEQEKLAPYLYRIATNLVRSEFRRMRRWRTLLPWIEHAEPAQPESPARRIFESEIIDRVQGALASLPMTYRAPLVLREIEGWSYQEIAKALDCREGTIKSRIARGRDQLRALLAPYWNGGSHGPRIDRAAPALVAEKRSF